MAAMGVAELEKERIMVGRSASEQQSEYSEFEAAAAVPATLAGAESQAVRRDALRRRLEWAGLAHAALLVESIFEEQPEINQVVLYSGKHSQEQIMGHLMTNPGSLGVMSTTEHTNLLRAAHRSAEDADTLGIEKRWEETVSNNIKAEDKLSRVMGELRQCWDFMKEMPRHRGLLPLRIQRGSASEIAAKLGFPAVGAAIEATRIGEEAATAPARSKKIKGL